VEETTTHKAKPVTKSKPKFKRRADARPDEVLDAALQLFMSTGFEATRVEDIAKIAGISKATVYLYFPSKIALLEGLVRRSISPLVKSAESAMATFDGSALDALKLGLSIACSKLVEPKVVAVPVIVLREGNRFPEIARLYFSEVVAHILPSLIAVVERGIARGEFREVDPELTVRNIVGPLMFHFLAAMVFNIGDISPDGLRRFLENHLDVLLNGLHKGSENG